MDIAQILNRPSPDLLIFDDTYDAELEVKKEIGNILEKEMAFSSWNLTSSPPKKLGIALNSIVFFLAEDFASKGTDLKSTVLMRREHFEEAIGYVRNLLERSSAEFLSLIREWEQATTRFLSAQLGKTSKREAIFRTCEQFKIDLFDFTQVFATLPSR